MRNTQDSRNIQSNALISNLAPMASSLEQIMRVIDHQSFYITLQEAWHVVQEPVLILNAFL